MKLPFRPILSVLLLLGGFVCLAIGLISFKQLQLSAPETLPRNMVAITPTLPPIIVTPTPALPQIGIKIISATGSAIIVLDNPQAMKVTGLSLRLQIDRQLAAPAAPFAVSSRMNQAGWATAVNSLTLENNRSFFDLALAALQPGGLSFTPQQVLANLPVGATGLSVDPALSRLIDDKNTTYQLVTLTK